MNGQSYLHYRTTRELAKKLHLNRIFLLLGWFRDERIIARIISIYMGPFIFREW